MDLLDAPRKCYGNANTVVSAHLTVLQERSDSTFALAVPGAAHIQHRLTDAAAESSLGSAQTISEAQKRDQPERRNQPELPATRHPSSGLLLLECSRMCGNRSGFRLVLICAECEAGRLVSALVHRRDRSAFG